MSTVPPPSTPKEVLAQAGWFSAAEWAEAIGEEEKTFWGKVLKNEIPHMPWGSRHLVNKEDLLQYLNTHKELGNGKEK
ncbi:helix-turn-helix domain-containing protein [Planctomicrobium piriforme]|uniref:Helix-turn-helix domain-containing protein n=1 Tax=Planctomicrobium piriforme TaxID=1576369 RepID=A0A1I3EAE0_9PLAN|nr:helix-turn-helix domain-containing protein [Planctomicrobium piriforme]SFH95937.1 hypothetical protein SAMN05421753_104141 [Planctomicrobium piriforme]